MEQTMTKYNAWWFILMAILFGILIYEMGDTVSKAIRAFWLAVTALLLGFSIGVFIGALTIPGVIP
jgi:hypothetical protein